jgi:hypothetical protein
MTIEQIQHDDIPAEIDFSKGSRGKFFHANNMVSLPLYLDNQVQVRLAALANAKGKDFSVFVNELLRKDIELIEIAQ